MTNITQQFVLESIVCVDTGGEGKGMCYRDSGNPLVDPSNDKLIGFASFTDPCAKGYPDGYLRIAQYIDWIREYVTLPNQ